MPIPQLQITEPHTLRRILHLYCCDRRDGGAARKAGYCAAFVTAPGKCRNRRHRSSDSYEERRLNIPEIGKFSPLPGLSMWVFVAK
jgi:hypothetical protein